MENAGIFLLIWNILRSFGVHILWPFGNVMVIWYIFPRFGILCQEKSGNLGLEGLLDWMHRCPTFEAPK
jgi:hypothetical protein